MDVQRASGIETRIDRGKAHDAFLIRELPAAQVGIVIGTRDRADIAVVDFLVRVDPAPARIRTTRIAMPDIDDGAGDRLAGHRIDDRQFQHQRKAVHAFADVSPDQFRVSKIRAGDLFG
ncbi:hypothetical protein D9M71_673340 [compost metagenome]